VRSQLAEQHGQQILAVRIAKARCFEGHEDGRPHRRVRLELHSLGTMPCSVKSDDGLRRFRIERHDAGRVVPCKSIPADPLPVPPHDDRADFLMRYVSDMKPAIGANDCWNAQLAIHHVRRARGCSGKPV
jgi:hypothetical protein